MTYEGAMRDEQETNDSNFDIFDTVSIIFVWLRIFV